MKHTIYIDKTKDDYIGFVDGVLEASTYSYYIDSSGDVELDKDETRKIYEVMKAYYEGESQKETN